jgi:hypothetical protein
MKKHFFGLALFSFIFGTTIFIYSMLHIANIEEVASPNYSPTYSKRTSCWKMKRESNRANTKSPIVRQAIFNSQTKQLKWELDTSGVNTPIVLKFFIKDEKGAHYINSRLVPAEAYQNGFVSATSFYELNNLDSYENLYVIAEPLSFSEQQYENFSLKFDADKATPVLVY